MSSWAIVTSEQFNHPACCWGVGGGGVNVLWDYLQRNLIAKSIKCWLLLALLPIENKWFWQCIQTGKSIPEGFFCGVGLLYSCKHGKWFPSHLRVRLPLTTGGLSGCRERCSSQFASAIGRKMIFEHHLVQFDAFKYEAIFFLAAHAKFKQNNCCTFSGSCLEGLKLCDQR